MSGRRKLCQWTPFILTTTSIFRSRASCVMCPDGEWSFVGTAKLLTRLSSALVVGGCSTNYAVLVTHVPRSRLKLNFVRLVKIWEALRFGRNLNAKCWTDLAQRGDDNLWGKPYKFVLRNFRRLPAMKALKVPPPFCSLANSWGRTDTLESPSIDSWVGSGHVWISFTEFTAAMDRFKSWNRAPSLTVYRAGFRALFTWLDWWCWRVSSTHILGAEPFWRTGNEPVSCYSANQENQRGFCHCI